MAIFHVAFAAFAWLIGHLPFRLLYLFSDFLYLIIYYLIGYRKEVVFRNLCNAFPELSDQERKKIAKKYYRNMADIIVETIKIRFIDKASLLKRVTFKNPELIDAYHAKNQSVMACIGHCGNWEWMSVSLQMTAKHNTFGIYKPLSDKWFNNYLIESRTRFVSNDGGLIPFKQTLRFLLHHRKDLTLSIIAADQTPHVNEINYWTQFLNQDTPVFLGPEKMAKKLNLALVFLEVLRTGRGRYSVEARLLTDQPGETADYEITQMHVRALEASIRKNPDNWLWSHRRWKHKKK